jgi:cytochrome c-type biogenesis protein CcmH/NrfG
VLILAYTKAQVMQADGKVTDEAKKGLEIVLMIQPENPDARYFMALRKLQDGQTSEAMGDMKALYKSLPADSPLKATIDRQIGRK